MRDGECSWMAVETGRGRLSTACGWTLHTLSTCRQDFELARDNGSIPTWESSRDKPGRRQDLELSIDGEHRQDLELARDNVRDDPGCRHPRGMDKRLTSVIRCRLHFDLTRGPESHVALTPVPGPEPGRETCRTWPLVALAAGILAIPDTEDFTGRKAGLYRVMYVIRCPKSHVGQGQRDC